MENNKIIEITNNRDIKSLLDTILRNVNNISIQLNNKINDNTQPLENINNNLTDLRANIENNINTIKTLLEENQGQNILNEIKTYFDNINTELDNVFDHFKKKILNTNSELEKAYIEFSQGVKLEFNIETKDYLSSIKHKLENNIIELNSIFDNFRNNRQKLVEEIENTNNSLKTKINNMDDEINNFKMSVDDISKKTDNIKNNIESTSKNYIDKLQELNKKFEEVSNVEQVENRTKIIFDNWYKEASVSSNKTFKVFNRYLAIMSIATFVILMVGLFFFWSASNFLEKKLEIDNSLFIAKEFSNITYRKIEKNGDITIISNKPFEVKGNKIIFKN